MRHFGQKFCGGKLRKLSSRTPNSKDFRRPATFRQTAKNANFIGTYPAEVVWRGGGERTKGECCVYGTNVLRECVTCADSGVANAHGLNLMSSEYRFMDNMACPT